jgi:hypothetical protein
MVVYDKHKIIEVTEGKFNIKSSALISKIYPNFFDDMSEIRSRLMSAKIYIEFYFKDDIV